MPPRHVSCVTQVEVIGGADKYQAVCRKCYGHLMATKENRPPLRDETPQNAFHGKVVDSGIPRKLFSSLHLWKLKHKRQVLKCNCCMFKVKSHCFARSLLQFNELQLWSSPLLNGDMGKLFGFHSYNSCAFYWLCISIHYQCKQNKHLNICMFSAGFILINYCIKGLIWVQCFSWFLFSTTWLLLSSLLNVYLRLRVNFGYISVKCNLTVKVFFFFKSNSAFLLVEGTVRKHTEFSLSWQSLGWNWFQQHSLLRDWALV